MSATSKWSLIGIADQQGVINVGGRIGAAHGPQEFRKAFARLKGRVPVQNLMQDCGNIAGLGQRIDENHRIAAEAVRRAHQVTGLSVVVGGGHDHGFSHLAGVVAAGKGKKGPRVGCINIDAHLDVRKPAPQAGSGSPFWLALEGGVLSPKDFVEFGVQSHCNAPELWDYVENKKVRVVPFESLRGGRAVTQFRTALTRLKTACDEVVISFDLDALAEAHAPGVSAPQAEGFTPGEVIEMMEIAGEMKEVKSLGIFELNPSHDVDYRTARLAATAAWHFLARALTR